MGILGLIFAGDTTGALIYLVSTLLVVLYMLPLHEFAHAFVADKLGDTTPRYTGRLTINPMKHIDPLGSLMLLLFGFGWAKPVQVNMNKFKNPKAGMALTAAAGPVSNLMAGFVCSFFRQLFLYLKLTTGSEAFHYLSEIFEFMVVINISLAIFNLLPIPPLDGSRILNAFLPDKYYYKIMQIEQYTFIIIMVLALVGFFKFLSFIVYAIASIFFMITGLPFGF